MACSRILSPDEPHMVIGTIPKLRISDYQQRVWATRRRPWVDRLACAWLIRRFIDPRAKFLWMSNPAECPAGAIGFDFDGATFSHVDNRVTFEVLLAGFLWNRRGFHAPGYSCITLMSAVPSPRRLPGWKVFWRDYVKPLPTMSNC